MKNVTVWEDGTWEERVGHNILVHVQDAASLLRAIDGKTLTDEDKEAVSLLRGAVDCARARGKIDG